MLEYKVQKRQTDLSQQADKSEREALLLGIKELRIDEEIAITGSPRELQSLRSYLVYKNKDNLLLKNIKVGVKNGVLVIQRVKIHKSLNLNGRGL